MKKKSQTTIHPRGPGSRWPSSFLFRGGIFFFSLIWIILPLTFFSGIAGWTQGWFLPASSNAHAEVRGMGEEDLRRSWMAHREWLAKKEWSRSQEELEKIYQWKLDRGVRNHYPYSLALLRESRRMEQGAMSAAVPGLLDYAEKMAPDFSEVARARARWFWSNLGFSWENAGKGLTVWLRGVFLSFSNPEEALPQLASLLLGILLSFLLAFGIFSIYLLVRYFSFALHHLEHLFGSKISSVPLALLGLLVAFSPFFLGWGWMWLFVLWPVLFWMYARRPDRFVILVLLLLLGFFPVGLRYSSSLFISLTDHGVPELIRANTGVWDSDLYRSLLTMSEDRPHDRDVLQALGLVEKRMGKFTEAEQRFLQWARLAPQSAAPFNNLGNIYLLTNQMDRAMEAYLKAIQLDPSRVEAYYNLGQAYLLKLRLREAEGEFQRAKALEPQRISYHTSISSRNPNRLVIDSTMEFSRVWKRAFSPVPEGNKLARGFWAMIWGGMPMEYGEAVVVVLFLLLGLLHWGTRRIPLIRRCERCGKLICSRCSGSRVLGKQCFQCLNAFSPNPSADPRVVKKKRMEAARYQVRSNSLPTRLSLIVPGIGHLVRGKSPEGIIYVFLLGLFLTFVAGGVRGGSHLLVPNPWLSIPGTLLAAAAFLGFYVWVQYRMKRIPSQGGNAHFRKG